MLDFYQGIYKDIVRRTKSKRWVAEAENVFLVANRTPLAWVLLRPKELLA